MVHHMDPDYVHEIYEMQLEVALKNAELLYQAVGNKIQAVYISGTDFGLQRGPYMALEAFQAPTAGEGLPTRCFPCSSVGRDAHIPPR